MVGTLMSWAVLGLSTLGLALPAPVSDASIEERQQQVWWGPAGVELIWQSPNSPPDCLIYGIKKDLAACFAILAVIPGQIIPGHPKRQTDISWGQVTLTWGDNSPVPECFIDNVLSPLEECYAILASIPGGIQPSNKRDTSPYIITFPGGVEFEFGPGSSIPKCFINGVQKDVKECYAILGIIPGTINPGKREVVERDSSPYIITFPGGITITWGPGTIYPDCFINGLKKKFNECFVLLGSSTSGVIPSIPIPGGAIVPDPTVPGGAIIVSP